jgi:hypothetical protein
MTNFQNLSDLQLLDRAGFQCLEFEFLELEFIWNPPLVDLLMVMICLWKICFLEFGI